MIVAVLNTKGGVGKTTTALNLITARVLDGRDVLAVDGDRQGSLIAAMANRETSKIAVAHYAEGQVLRQQVSIAKERYQDIIIDAGGRDNSALRAAMMLADLILIPFQPRSVDVWALSDMASLLDEARATKDIRAVAFLSMADSSGRDNTDAAESVPSGIEYLDAMVGRRKAYSDSFGRGMGVLEEAGSNAKARFEIRRLVDSVFNDAV